MQESDNARLQAHEKWWSRLKTRQQIRAFRRGIGSMDAISRRVAVEYLKGKDYRSLLDCGAGTGLFYDCLVRAALDIEYTAIDITSAFVEDGRKRGLNIHMGSVENMRFPFDSFDVCYARHLLEHLSHYKNALQEMVRIARKEVMHTFFIPPEASPDKIRLVEDSFGVKSPCHYNSYCRSEMEQYVMGLRETSYCFWEEIKGDATNPEVTLHIIKKS